MTCCPLIRLLATVVCCASAALVLASDAVIDLRRIDPVTGDAAAGQAKAATCGACHGTAGIAAVPQFPNLAGQSAEYLYWSLIAFQREARADSPMTAIVADLTDAELRNLAVYFASMAPVPDTVVRAHDSPGGVLFLNGDPARGVPPCQGCHGSNGDGHPLAALDVALRAIPQLRNQPAEYIVQKLAEYRDGRHRLTSGDRIMQGIAQTLDDTSIRQIATWLQPMPQ